MIDSAYWMALAHLPGWKHRRINELIIWFHHEKQIPISDFFQLPNNIWQSEYQLTTKEISDLCQAKADLPNLAFLAENLLNQGFELIPITSANYPSTLKNNLKTTHAPSLLYVKGNIQLLHENSIAIVGSRNASNVALQFTDNIAKRASQDYQVIVSGFAKGVDRQALDSAMKYRGHSIIVLPQGVLTFGTGYQTYYKQIVDGDVLVLSVFLPKAPWRPELAMARNPIIYGLAQDIYVAESSEKGGTWSGVIDGIRKGRKIFVRNPEPHEKNANELLIRKGAIPVSFSGEVLPPKIYPDSLKPDFQPIAAEPTTTPENEKQISLF
ncbi:MAG: DNA transporter [Candidatus Marinimicrobia bacterium CG08_land_8_20_14_0_20_45_22]|nr:MAG: DNA transporter [Candidatus Marinimicrobia bacterium CG08_land_8_20_14_0_20_45_22]